MEEILNVSHLSEFIQIMINNKRGIDNDHEFPLCCVLKNSVITRMHIFKYLIYNGNENGLISSLSYR